jgi:hypothetical protein
MESKSHFQIPFSTSRESLLSNTRTNAAAKHCKTSKYNNLKIKFNALKKSKTRLNVTIRALKKEVARLKKKR